jgi:hypothetical protein
MAPVTRLQRSPNRRVDYSPQASRNGAHRNRNQNQNPPPERPNRADANAAPVALPTQDDPEARRARMLRLAAERLIHPTMLFRNRSSPGQIGSEVEHIEEHEPEDKNNKECFICATRKPMTSYTSEETVPRCSHFVNTCNRCVKRMLRTEITLNRVQTGALSCPMFQCEYKISAGGLSQIVGKDTFEA